MDSVDLSWGGTSLTICSPYTYKTLSDASAYGRGAVDAIIVSVAGSRESFEANVAPSPASGASILRNLICRCWAAADAVASNKFTADRSRVALSNDGDVWTRSDKVSKPLQELSIGS